MIALSAGPCNGCDGGSPELGGRNCPETSNAVKWKAEVLGGLCGQLSERLKSVG